MTQVAMRATSGMSVRLRALPRGIPDPRRGVEEGSPQGWGVLVVLAELPPPTHLGPRLVARESHAKITMAPRRRAAACRSVARLRRLLYWRSAGAERSVARGSNHRAAGGSRSPSTSDARRRTCGLDDRPWLIFARTRYPPR